MLLNCGVGEDSLRVPWTARRSNQSILKESSPGCSLEGLILNLKLQIFGHLMWQADSLEKTLILGKIEGRRRRDDRGWDDWMASSTQWTWVWVNSGNWWWQGGLACCSQWGHKEPAMTEWLDWTELKVYITMYPAWGQFLLPEEHLANPFILKCKWSEWVSKIFTTLSHSFELL